MCDLDDRELAQQASAAMRVEMGPSVEDYESLTEDRCLKSVEKVALARQALHLRLLSLAIVY